jgi:hypothetical protein
MSDEDADRGGSYRRRLARAAAASCALHMLLFGGLTVSRLELELDAPESPEARAPKNMPKKPKRPAADFALQVPRSASAETPAHERPLELPVSPPALTPTDPRERPPEWNIADRPAQPAEEQPAVVPQPPVIEPTRARDTAAAPADRQAPSRQADATPAEPAATAAAADPARTVDGAAGAAAPAALTARERPEAARVAARWRPREVALLERLTAQPPEATALAARDKAAAASSASPAPLRRSTADARSADDARAEPVAAAPAAPPTTPPTVTPTARATARRESSRAATARTAAAADMGGGAPRIETGSSAPPATVARSARQAGAGGGSPAAAAGTSSPARRQTAGGTGSTQVEMPAAGTARAESAGAAGQIAPAATSLASSAGSGRAGSRGSAVARGRQTGGDSGSESEPMAVGPSLAGADAIAAGGTLGTGSRARSGEAAGGDGVGGQARQPLARDAGGSSTTPVEGGTVATVGPVPGGITAAWGLAGTGASSAAGGAGDRGDRLGPALLDRGRRGTSGRSALTATRAADHTAGRVEAGDGESLSVAPADIAALGAAGRARAGLPDRVAAPRSPDRIAAATLPTDGRVRDVAPAFAGRTAAASRPAGGIEDPATLERARKMVDRGLEFLARSQLADGRWRLTEFAGGTEADIPKLDSDAAATGLALLAFFGAGHDHFAGEYRDTVRRGLEFLISVQKPDGDLFLPADDLSNSCGWLYSHGIASLALCEAVGMTGDPLVRPAAEKACGFIAASRHPTLGGWRYTPRSDADLSVSGWMLVALRAGDLGGVKTDPAALDGVRMLLAASATPGAPTRYAYNARKADQRRTDLSVACMTAVGTLMRLHTGAAAADPEIVAAGRVLAGVEPSYGTATLNRRDAYLWYYASQALVHTGGPDWQRWYSSLVATLEPEQRLAGALGGSWDATGTIPDRWGAYGGRVYVTALHLLALEVPWRHLPTYAQAPGR